MARVPVKPPAIDTVLSSVGTQRLETIRQLGPEAGGRYLHWDQVRYRPPPEGLTREEWWAGLSLARQAEAIAVPIQGKDGKPFFYSLSEPVRDRLRRLDQMFDEREAVERDLFRSDYYLDRMVGFVEESITSAQLEGAEISLEDAQAVLGSPGASPGISELMVHNNYQALIAVQDMADEPLTSDMICELQARITEGTLADTDDGGRFQRPQDRRVQVMDTRDGEVMFVPPPAAELPERIARLCEFANDTGGESPHPLLRAVILHFWLAYLHPFADGNGRCARALFYWSATRDDYYFIDLISISAVILEAPAQYARAFLYSEIGDNDLTYFLIHQMNVLGKALRRKPMEAKSRWE